MLYIVIVIKTIEDMINVTPIEGTLRFTRNFNATVLVKLAELEKVVTITERFSGENKGKFTVEFNDSDTARWVEETQKTLGITLNFAPVLEIHDSLKGQRAQEIIDEKIDQLTKAHESNPAHEIIAAIKEEFGSRITASLTYNIEKEIAKIIAGEHSYNQISSNIKISYNNFSEVISLVRGNNPNVINSFTFIDTSNGRYLTKKYKTVSGAVRKIIAIADRELAVKSDKITRKEIAKIESDNIVNAIKTQLGFDTDVTFSTNYQNRPLREGGVYESFKYIHSIKSPKRIVNVSANLAKESTFSVAGIHNLSAEEAKAILNILL